MAGQLKACRMITGPALAGLALITCCIAFLFSFLAFEGKSQ